MDKKTSKIILAIILIISIILFSKFYSDILSSASEDVQSLYLAIIFSLVGIFFHFIKNYQKIQKRTKMTMESLELLMLVLTPAEVSYKVLGEAFPNNPYAIIVPTVIALFSWYIITIIRTSKIEDKIDGKDTFSFTMLFFWGTIVGLIPFIWLAMLIL